MTPNDWQRVVQVLRSARWCAVGAFPDPCRHHCRGL